MGEKYLSFCSWQITVLILSPSQCTENWIGSRTSLGSKSDYCFPHCCLQQAFHSAVRFTRLYVVFYGSPCVTGMFVNQLSQDRQWVALPSTGPRRLDLLEIVPMASFCLEKCLCPHSLANLMPVTAGEPPSVPHRRLGICQWPRPQS